MTTSDSIMPTPKLAAPVMVETNSALRELALRLRHEPLVAVDTESNSLFAYYERVCLIQISTRKQDWVVDPIAINDLSPLKEFFAAPHIEKVFHAAEYDIMCMKRDFGFTFNNLFDTMYAARILGLKAFGLGALLESYFNIQVDKRFQRADWSQRPIPREQLRYAQQDTHYLLALRDILRDMLYKEDRLIEAREVFAQLTEVPAAEHVFDPDGFWKINAARDFSRQQFAILRELYLLREQIASQRNRPPFKVITDETLAEVVKAEPTTIQELSAVSGMSHIQVEKNGSKILQAIQRGLRAKPPVRPDRSPRTDPATLTLFDALHEWRKMRAIQRGVESDVILPKDTLWALAKSVPQNAADLVSVYGLGPWKREQYGEELLAIIQKVTAH
jgi:ribonuclease D